MIGLAMTAKSQMPNDTIKGISNKLSKGEISVSDVLSNKSYMQLHSVTSFREVIKQNATTKKISLVNEAEPGTRITVSGIILDASGRPQSGKLIYVYQTSSEGWYSDTAPHINQNEGDRRHARIFGYLRTDAEGKFSFTTVKPKGYPHSDLPAHIHIEIEVDKNKYFISELLFDDDPRLVGEIRARSIRDNFLIVKNTHTKDQPLYTYVIRISN
jgi:protocatechuate 3,4-dioxygenase beta subunit